jgi:hypothetical protein
MEGLGDELDELEAEMAALEMESEPVAVGAIHCPSPRKKVDELAVPVATMSSISVPTK